MFGMHMARTVPPGLWGIPLVNKPFVYIISLIVGSAVVAGVGTSQTVSTGKKQECPPGCGLGAILGSLLGDSVAKHIYIIKKGIC